MTKAKFRTGAFLSLALLVTSACATEGGPGSSSSDPSGSTGSSPSASDAKGIGRIAVGAVEDSLKACLARIPSDATSGQRMLAERSCERDEAARKR